MGHFLCVGSVEILTYFTKINHKNDLYLCKKAVVFFCIPIGTRKPSKNGEKTIKEIEKMSEKLC